METLLIELSGWLVFFFIPSIPWVILLYLVLDKGRRLGFKDICWMNGFYGALPLLLLSVMTFYSDYTTPHSEVKSWYHSFCFMWSCGPGHLLGALISFGVFNLFGLEGFLAWLYYSVLAVFWSGFGYLTVTFIQSHWEKIYWKRIIGFLLAWVIVIVPQIQIIVGRFFQSYFLFDWGDALGILR